MFFAEKCAGDDVEAGGVGGGNMLSHPALSIEEDDTAEGGESRDRPDCGQRQRCSPQEDSVPKNLPFCARNVQGGRQLNRLLPAANPAGPMFRWGKLVVSFCHYNVSQIQSHLAKRLAVVLLWLAESESWPESQSSEFGPKLMKPIELPPPGAVLLGTLFRPPHQLSSPSSSNPFQPASTILFIFLPGAPDP